MKNTKIPYFQQIENQISNTLAALYEKRIVYYYLSLKHEPLSKDILRLSWNNHISGTLNTNDYFLSLEQYKFIIDNNSYLCILYDGSLIRVSYTFDKDTLIGQNLLWWPAPYSYKKTTLNDVTPQQLIQDFLDDQLWHENIKMRSPIRIDYDPDDKVVSPNHPAAHLHMQHKDCRINVEKPMCFNRFMKFILGNYYPFLSFYFDDRDNIHFNLGTKNYIESTNTKIIC